MLFSYRQDIIYSDDFECAARIKCVSTESYLKIQFVNRIFLLLTFFLGNIAKSIFQIAHIWEKCTISILSHSFMVSVIRTSVITLTRDTEIDIDLGAMLRATKPTEGRRVQNSHFCQFFAIFIG